MTGACISEPVSYLRLERYLLDEVSAQERAALQTHLSQCAACQTCFEALRSEEAALLPLSLQAQASPPSPASSVLDASGRVRGLRVPAMVAVSALSFAAAALLLVRGPGASPSLDVSASSSVKGSGVKGGELAISLVRQHEGSRAVDDSVFVSGDRFEVQVSCAPGAPVRWDVVVLQAGEAFFPLAADSALRCGNHVTLPGAFSLTGTEPARVCVVLQCVGAIDRARLASQLPQHSACTELLPAHARRR